MKLCKPCLKRWKRTKGWKAAKAQAKRTGRKPKTFYPKKLFFDGAHSMCDLHMTYSLAANARRRVSKLNATVSWADNKKIREVYTEARRLTKTTGVQHHVDHIVPLQGKYVCGLHVHYNLQPLPASENIRKRNKASYA